MKIEIIHRKDGKIKLIAPYNEDFPKKARDLGGDWSGCAWVFDAEKEDMVRARCAEVYGCDGTLAGQEKVMIKMVVDHAVRKASLTEVVEIFFKGSVDLFERKTNNDDGYTLTGICSRAVATTLLKVSAKGVSFKMSEIPGAINILIEKQIEDVIPETVVARSPLSGLGKKPEHAALYSRILSHLEELAAA